MTMTVGGSLGITFPDANTVSTASMSSLYYPFVTNYADITTIKNGVHFSGTNGLILRQQQSSQLNQSYVTYTSGNTINLTISASTNNYNVRLAAIAAGWVGGTTPVNIYILIRGGVIVGSSSTGSYAFDTGSPFPTGSLIVLTNIGLIVGAGGAGGARLNTGQPGGTAIRAQTPIIINNGGIISGGGGGGGGGGIFGNGGGGGQGQVGGAGGSGYSVSGASGTIYSPGAASGDAGTGGTLGSDGVDGTYAGGAGGAALIGASFVNGGAGIDKRSGGTIFGEQT